MSLPQDVPLIVPSELVRSRPDAGPPTVDATALPLGAQVARPQNAAGGQLVAPQGHWMAADGHPGTGVIGDEALGKRTTYSTYKRLD